MTDIYLGGLEKKRESSNTVDEIDSSNLESYWSG
jgi:hypothetical protein